MTHGPAISEAAIDPKWTVNVIQLDGAGLIVLTIDHPRLGRVNAILPASSATAMRAALDTALTLGSPAT